MKLEHTDPLASGNALTSGQRFYVYRIESPTIQENRWGVLVNL